MGASVFELTERLGLRPAEFAWLLASEIEKLHLSRGELVHAHVHLTPQPAVDVVRFGPHGQFTEPRPQRRVFYPDEQSFRDLVDAYAHSQTGRLGWEIVRATCTALHDDYSLVALDEHPAFSGETAVLPHPLLAARDAGHWGRGAVRYVAVFKPRVEHFPGAQAWRRTGARLVATRRNSIFLRLLVQRFLQRQVRGEIVGDLGMVVVGPHEAIADYVGERGANSRLLAELAGLAEVVVAREPASVKPDARLISAIRQLTQLKAFALVPPNPPDAAWRVRVDAAGARRFAARPGYRLTLVMRLSGVRFQIEEVHS
jgi:hypothetical protein